MIRAENSNISGFYAFQFVCENAIYTELEANCTDLTFNPSNLEIRVSREPCNSGTDCIRYCPLLMFPQHFHTPGPEENSQRISYV